MMSNNKPGEWQGPFESRKEFEVFQDRCVLRLAQFALDRPQLTDDPERLKKQLWDLAEYLPVATLGLGRSNPDANQLYVWENTPKWNRGLKADVRISPGPTILKGQAAYERMANSWVEIGNLKHPHRFSVLCSLGGSRQLELAYSGKRSLLIGNWTIRQAAYEQRCQEHIVIPDVGQSEDIDAVAWDDAYAGAGNYVDRQCSYTIAPLSRPYVTLKGGCANVIWRRYIGCPG